MTPGRSCAARGPRQMRTAHGHALLHAANQEAAPGSAAESCQVRGMRALAGSAQLCVQARPAVQMLRRATCTSSGAACKRCRTGICNSAHPGGQRERAVALSNGRSPRRKVAERPAGWSAGQPQEQRREARAVLRPESRRSSLAPHVGLLDNTPSIDHLRRAQSAVCATCAQWPGTARRTGGRRTKSSKRAQVKSTSCAEESCRSSGQLAASAAHDEARPAARPYTSNFAYLCAGAPATFNRGGASMQLRLRTPQGADESERARRPTSWQLP